VPLMSLLRHLENGFCQRLSPTENRGSSKWVIGWKFKLVVQVAHCIAGGHTQYLRIFGRALKIYDRGRQIKTEDKSGKWAVRVRKCQDDLRAKAPQYKHDSQYDEVIAILFPELFSSIYI